MSPVDWDKYPNFNEGELACKHTGESNMHPFMMDVLQEIRHTFGKPIFISSGYRSKRHPVEASKDMPGEHALGMAVDIACHGKNAIDLIAIAVSRGVRRIGVHQKGRASTRFIHLGVADKFDTHLRAALWTY